MQTYCCNDFEIVVKDGGFIKQEDGTWVTVGHLFCKFCPFCGAALESRLKVIGIGKDWAVIRSPTWVVGLFESREAAEAYKE